MELFSLELEFGVAESFQYVKLIGVALLLAALWHHRPSWLYAVWALLFGLLAVDDSLALHERLGDWLTRNLNLSEHLPAALPPEGVGEVLGLGCMASLTLPWIVVGHAKACDFVRLRGWILYALVLLYGSAVTLLGDLATAIPSGAAVGDGLEMLIVSTLLSGLVESWDRDRERARRPRAPRLRAV